MSNSVNKKFKKFENHPEKSKSKEKLCNEEKKPQGHEHHNSKQSIPTNFLSCPEIKGLNSFFVRKSVYPSVNKIEIEASLRHKYCSLHAPPSGAWGIARSDDQVGLVL